MAPLKSRSGKVLWFFAMRSHSKKSDEDPEPDFNRYPDREVIFLGIPYTRAKLVNNVWYQRMLDGGYRRFPFQRKVQEVVPPEMEIPEEKPKWLQKPERR